MSLTLGLSIARSGLSTSQKGLEVTSHNIANEQTEGFTRKVFTQQSRAFGLKGVGGGVFSGEVMRRVEEGVRRSLWSAKGVLADLDTSFEYSMRIQRLLGKPEDTNSLSHAVSLLAKEFETLGSDTSNPVQPTILTTQAQAFADKINQMSNKLQEERKNADQEISKNVDKINEYLEQICDLNSRIALARATGQGSADLDDIRDDKLSKLSELIDIQYYTGQNGEITIYTSGGSTLLSNTPVKVSHSPTLATTPGDTHEGGSFDGIMVGGIDITRDIRSGRLKALIEQRDEKLTAIQAQIDELARVMRTEINAAHNRGTSFPAMANDMTGSRTFIDPSRQTLSLASGDVAITLFNKDGSQFASTTLGTLMGGSGPWTATSIAASLETWLKSHPNGPSLATSGFTPDGKLNITLNSSEFSLSFRDQASSTPGSPAQDAQIAFDADGDGNTDHTISGFSNFFGLNDFFGSDQINHTWDSLPQSSTGTVVSGFVLSFSNKTLGMNFGSIPVAPGDTLESIAARINQDSTLNQNIRASVIRDGNLVKLRITSQDYQELEITQSGSASPGFDGLGLAPTATGEAGALRLTEKLKQHPDRVANGTAQYDAKTGKYYLSSGDNSNANGLAAVFSSEHTFKTAGGLATGKMKFSAYAAAAITATSTNAANIKSTLTYQQSVVENLDMRDGQISGVNRDEELTNMIIFQQTYSASARVISTIQAMLETLNSMVR